MALLAPNNEAILKILEALGLKDQPIRRFVLDVSVNAAPTLYVECFLDEQNISSGFLNGVADLKPEVVVVGPGQMLEVDDCKVYSAAAPRQRCPHCFPENHHPAAVARPECAVCRGTGSRIRWNEMRTGRKEGE